MLIMPFTTSEHKLFSKPTWRSQPSRLRRNLRISDLHYVLNIQVKSGDERLNGSKVTEFSSKSKMAVADILFQAGNQFLVYRRVLHYILNTYFKFGDIWSNG